MADKKVKKITTTHYKLVHPDSKNSILRPIASTGKDIYSKLIAKGYVIEEV